MRNFIATAQGGLAFHIGIGARDHLADCIIIGDDRTRKCFQCIQFRKQSRLCLFGQNGSFGGGTMGIWCLIDRFDFGGHDILGCW